MLFLRFYSVLPCPKWNDKTILLWKDSTASLISSTSWLLFIDVCTSMVATVGRIQPMPISRTGYIFSQWAKIIIVDF